jgi:hypothetical protein
LLTTGSVRFSERRKKELRGYFAMAGINIDSIKTKKDYLEARQAASPYFEEWLESIVTSKPMTTERKMLLETLRGNDAEVARLKIRLETERLAKKNSLDREA